MAEEPSTLSELYAALLVTELPGLSSPQSLDLIGRLVDVSDVLGKYDGANRALALSDQLEPARLTEAEAALLEYFRANAWSVLQQGKASEVWDWEQPALGQQIFHLRKCVNHKGFPKLEKVRRCQVLTNLGNCMDTVGRFIEAQDYWGQAITLEPKFGMAIGNKGCGLEAYARALYDPGHQLLFLKFARVAVKTASRKGTLFDGPYPQALAHFNLIKNRIDYMAPHLSSVKLHEHAMGRSNAERKYRRWCLENRLYLNPLNDLGPHSVANRDILMLPSFWTKTGEPPTLVGFFNQLKQEYASARWLLYEGAQTYATHFSDRDVLLYNTLDYSSHALAVEKTKVAFRMAYSMFDKMAFFLNEYLQLGVQERDVYFRTIWYQNRNTKPYPLRMNFANLDNWPFRGLFWLAKDLFDGKLSDVIEPEARDIYMIRNRLEHGGLRVYEDFVAGIDSDLEIFSNRLSYSIARSNLNAKALRLFKLVRAALIYLLLGMHREEARRVHDDGRAASFPLQITTLNDDWKS